MFFLQKYINSGKEYSPLEKRIFISRTVGGSAVRCRTKPKNHEIENMVQFLGFLSTRTVRPNIGLT